MAVDDFTSAWRAETIDYGDPYTMRTGFRKVGSVRLIRCAVPHS